LTCPEGDLDYRERAYAELVARWHKCRPEVCDNCTPLLKNGKPFIRVVHPDDVTQKEGKEPLPLCSHLGLTTVAQPSLEADILIIGQDWGAASNYRNAWSLDKAGIFEGFGKPYSKNPYLRNLGKAIGALLNEPGTDYNFLLKKHKEIFLINSMLCLKQGIGEGGQDVDDIPIETGNYDKEWTRTCTKQFIPSILDIIRPKAVITMGDVVSRSLIELVETSYDSVSPLPMKFGIVYGNLHPDLFIELVKDAPFEVTIQKTRPTFQNHSTFLLFPVSHCGAISINTNRAIEEYCYNNKGRIIRSELWNEFKEKTKEKRIELNCGKTSTQLYLEDWRRIGNYIRIE